MKNMDTPLRCPGECGFTGPSYLVHVSPRPYDTDASLGVDSGARKPSFAKKLKSGTDGRYSRRCDCWKDGGLGKQKKDTNADIKKRLMNLQKMAIMSNEGFATTQHVGKIHREPVMNQGKIYAAVRDRQRRNWLAQA
jgi:hypothetical protein